MNNRIIEKIVDEINNSDGNPNIRKIKNLILSLRPFDHIYDGKRDEDSYFGYNILHILVLHDQYKLCKFILDKQLIDINSRDQFNKWTPLHHAAYHAHETILNLLFSTGADPYKIDDDGRTPVDVVAQDLAHNHRFHEDESAAKSIVALTIFKKHGIVPDKEIVKDKIVKDIDLEKNLKKLFSQPEYKSKFKHIINQAKSKQKEVK